MNTKKAKSIIVTFFATLCLTFGFTSAAQAFTDSANQEGISFISDQVPETSGMCSLPCGNNKAD